jgi:large subunit ribosomal protein L29
MAILRVDEIRKMSKEERSNELSELKAELSSLMSKRSMGGSMENPARISLIRQTVAKIYTINREEELGIDKMRAGRAEEENKGKDKQKEKAKKQKKTKKETQEEAPEEVAEKPAEKPAEEPKPKRKKAKEPEQEMAEAGEEEGEEEGDKE